jgi:hypothetical protein
MSTSNQFVWNFDEGTLNEFEYLFDDGRFEDIAEEILDNTNLSTVFVDEVRGYKEVYNYDEDKFNDDVLTAIRIIHDRYELIKEENEEDSIN